MCVCVCVCVFESCKDPLTPTTHICFTQGVLNIACQGLVHEALVWVGQDDASQLMLKEWGGGGGTAHENDEETTIYTPYIFVYQSISCVVKVCIGTENQQTSGIVPPSN